MKYTVLALFFSYLTTSVTTFAQAETERGNTPLPEIVVLFDQSGPFSQSHSKQAAKLWLQSFIKRQARPFQVSFSGFDETVHEYIDMAINSEADLSALADKVEALTSAGRVTDIEAAFSYILKQKSSKPVKSILVISDGKSEVWDRKLAYISKRVKADPRYKELHRQRAELKKTNISLLELYDRLGPEYYEKNIQLLEALLPKIKEQISGQLIFWDPTGQSKLIPKWADALSAKTLAVSFATTEPDAKAIDVFVTQLFNENSYITPSVHTEKSATLTKAQPVKTHPVEASQVEIPRVETPRTTVTPVKNNSTFAGETTLFSLAVVLLMSISAFYFYKNKKFNDVKSSLINTTKKHIDSEFEATMLQAEEKRKELVQKSQISLNGEKRLSMRVAVEPGAIIIHWQDKNNVEQTSNAIDISRHAIKFNCDNLNFNSKINKISCPRTGTTLYLIESLIMPRDDKSAVVVLKKFKNTVDDQLTWVDLISKINRGN